MIEVIYDICFGLHLVKKVKQRNPGDSEVYVQDIYLPFKFWAKMSKTRTAKQSMLLVDKSL